MARVHTPIAAPAAKATFLRRPGVWVGAVAVLLIAAAAVLRATVFARPADPMANVPTFAVARGPLLISVTQSGTIKSRQQEVIKCEVDGGSTILYLIPEGTRVKQGELLVELDASKLQDQLVSQEITVKNAEASVIGAEEALAVAQSQALSDVAQAKLDARFAEEDVDKYLKGDYQYELKGKQSKVSLAEEKIKQAQQKYDWSKKLFESKYVSKTELQSDELAYKSSTLDLALATKDLELLEEFTYKRKMDELKSAIEQTKMALERVERKAKADIIQAEASLSAKKAEYERQQSTLAKIKRMIQGTKIYAPVDGMVVYATTGDSRWNREPLIEGSTVRERQDLINLPTTSSVMAEVKIHESSLDKLSVGLPVRVLVDSLPGKTFTGKVARIAPLPDASSMWANPDLKVYNTIIYLDEGDDGLRTGMSCRAEIIVDYYQDAVYVPVQSVIRVGGQPTVYVADKTGPQPRPVKLGLDNNRMVRILDGLKEGEKVLLSPPLAAASTTDEPAPSTEKPPEGLIPTTRPTTQPTSRPSLRGDDAGAGGMRTLTPEQREEMRKRFEAMTPEQREAMRNARGPRTGGEGRTGGGEGRTGEGRGGGGGGRDRSGGGGPPMGGPR